MMVQIKYDPAIDVLVIGLREGNCVESDEVAPGMIVDFDADGVPLAIEILNARRVLNPSNDQSLSLPFQVNVG